MSAAKKTKAKKQKPKPARKSCSALKGRPYHIAMIDPEPLVCARLSDLLTVDTSQWKEHTLVWIEREARLYRLAFRPGGQNKTPDGGYTVADWNGYWVPAEPAKRIERRGAPLDVEAWVPTGPEGHGCMKRWYVLRPNEACERTAAFVAPNGKGQWGWEVFGLRLAHDSRVGSEPTPLEAMRAAERELDAFGLRYEPFDAPASMLPDEQKVAAPSVGDPFDVELRLREVHKSGKAWVIERLNDTPRPTSFTLRRHDLDGKRPQVWRMDVECTSDGVPDNVDVIAAELIGGMLVEAMRCATPRDCAYAIDTNAYKGGKDSVQRFNFITPLPLSAVRASEPTHAATSDELHSAIVFRDSYAEQLDDIGSMLVAAGFLTSKEIAREGVCFAVRTRLLSSKPHASKRG